MKEFSKFELAALKRNAANVNTLIKKKNKLQDKINSLAAELCEITKSIDKLDTPTREITGGFRTEDIIDAVVVNGTTKYVFKYPETIIPETPELIESLPAKCEDIDNTVVDEIETSPKDAPFNPIND